MEVTMTEMATGKMAVATEMTTTEVTAAEVASEGGGGRERSDRDRKSVV